MTRSNSKCSLNMNSRGSLMDAVRFSCVVMSILVLSSPWCELTRGLRCLGRLVVDPRMGVAGT